MSHTDAWRAGTGDIRTESVRSEVSALTGANHVRCADKAGVVRTNNMAELKRVFRIGNGRPNELSSQCPRRPWESRGDAFQVVGVTT